MKKIIWLTGLSASGKTTLAVRLCAKYGAELLDGDIVRAITQNTDFSYEGRCKQQMTIASVAGLLSKHTNVVVASISPYKEIRKEIMDKYPNIILVHISTPLSVCMIRDPKHLYKKALQGLIHNLTGMGDRYDYPERAKYRFNMLDEDILNDAVEKLGVEFDQKPRVMIPGRFQPFHKGHEWLVRQELEKGKSVVVAIRDTKISEKDPYPAHIRKEMVEAVFEGEDVEALIIPDIEAIAYGRKVGYEVRETKDIPAEIYDVSGSTVRKIAVLGTELDERVIIIINKWKMVSNV